MPLRVGAVVAVAAAWSRDVSSGTLPVNEVGVDVGLDGWLGFSSNRSNPEIRALNRGE